MTKIITENFRVENANEFLRSFVNDNEQTIQSFSNKLDEYNTNNSLGLTSDNVDGISNLLSTELAAQNQYYVFASSVDSDGPIDNTLSEKRDFLRRVIFGNKIRSSDIRYLFNARSWVSGAIYDAFDDTKDVDKLDMFVAVNDGVEGEGTYRVYKCIRNNNGQPSTVKPSIIGNEDSNFEFSFDEDGYTWKFMFEVPASEYLTYRTSNSLPYVKYQPVIDNAKQSVSDILIQSVRRQLFSDFVLGQCTLRSQEVDDEEENLYRLQIDTEFEAKKGVDSYVGMYIFFKNEGSVFDIVRSEYTNVLYLYVRSDQNPQYLIDTANYSDCLVVPKIKVSKGEKEDCIAWGDIDRDGNLNDIRFITKGDGYQYAQAELSLPSALEDTRDQNSLRAIVSPKGGHGSDPVSEMAMSKLILNTNFYSDTLTRIPESNYYTKVGLVKNPVFAHGGYPLDFDNRLVVEVDGNLTIDDQIIKVDSIVYQQKDQETATGRIHEIQYDSASDTTKIFLVDYSGTTQQIISAGEATVKENLTSESSETIVINNVSVNQIETDFGQFVDGNYKVYSGDLLHFIDFEPIQRQSTRLEKIKMVFDF